VDVVRVMLAICAIGDFEKPELMIQSGSFANYDSVLPATSLEIELSHQTVFDSSRTMSQPAIESLLQEKRLFPPPSEFSQKAHIKSFGDYQQLYDKAKADPEKFWADLAEELHWFQKWDTVLDWHPPFAKWFVGGKINISYNCLDRH
jgi:hypothetical protein